MLLTSENIKKISAALLAFQSSVRGVGKDSANPHFKNRYASLEAVADTIRPALQEVGVVFMQSPGAIIDGNMEMTTRFIHAESGEWIEGKGDIPLGKRDPQGAGSAQTYAQRYHLMAMLGLPPVDDDGEAAIDRDNSRPTYTAPAENPASLSKAKTRDLWGEMRDELDACLSVDDLGILWRSQAFQASFKTLPADWQRLLVEHKDGCKVRLDAANIPKVKPNFEALEKTNG